MQTALIDSQWGEHPMDDAERLTRLMAVLRGTGATLNDSHSLWGVDSKVNDDTIAALAPWADLRQVFVARAPISDRGLELLCTFDRLTALDIASTQVSSTALSQVCWPNSIETLGLSGLPLDAECILRIERSTSLTALNVNGCGTSRSQVQRVLAALPQLAILEARDLTVDDATARTFSMCHTELTLCLASGVWRGGTCVRRIQATR